MFNMNDAQGSLGINVKYLANWANARKKNFELTITVKFYIFHTLKKIEFQKFAFLKK